MINNQTIFIAFCLHFASFFLFLLLPPRNKAADYQIVGSTLDVAIPLYMIAWKTLEPCALDVAD